MIKLDGYCDSFNETFGNMVEVSDLRTTTKYNELDNVYEVDEQFAYVKLSEDYRNKISEDAQALIKDEWNTLELIEYLQDASRFLNELEFHRNYFTVYNDDGYEYYTKIEV